MDEHQNSPKRIKSSSSSSSSTAAPPPSHVNEQKTTTNHDSQHRTLKRQLTSDMPMPWFGLDIGGSLVKLVYFEPNNDSTTSTTSASTQTNSNCSTIDETEIDEEEQAMKDAENTIKANIRKYLIGEVAYGETGVRDKHLQISNVPISAKIGTLHFIRFPSYRMEAFLRMSLDKGFYQISSTVCATGGGAHKFEKDITHMKLKYIKFDEFEALINGIHYIEKHCPGSECYIYQNPQTPTKCTKKSTHLKNLYPYLVVNVGSGVSILEVTSPNQYKRVSGTSIGGGTFLGLAALMTNVKSYDEAIDLATRGDHTKVDKLVKDIYGGDYELFDLPGDIVAASFGHMINPDKRSEAKREDIARSLLVTITNNIGAIAMMTAKQHKIKNVLYTGNFLRINPISMKLLAFAMNYWSDGELQAIFMEHEGYFGAVGCLQALVTL